MIVNERKLYEAQLSCKELIALDTAERALADVTAMFGSNGTLVAAETGECIDLAELGRVRAVLDFFHDRKVFERV